MTDTLQAYQLPSSHLPGSPLLSKYICKQPSVMAVILEAVLGKRVFKDYYCGDTCLINGSRCDVLYQSPSSTSVMVQVQKNVTHSWLRSALVQCCQLIGDENHLPALCIFSLTPLPNDIKAICTRSAYAYDLDIPLFTQKIKLFCPELTQRYLTTATQSPSIVVLASFFSSQHRSAHTSAHFSKHAFYIELYRHAVQCCHRLAVDLEPIAANTIVPQRASTVQTTNPRKRRLLSPTASTSHNENGRGQRQTPMATTREHDQDVIIDYCKEQLDLGKDWQTIYDEGYGKYFMYMNKNSLKRAMSVHLRQEPKITKISQHNMKDIIRFCKRLVDKGMNWEMIYHHGKGKYFAYQNSHVLHKVYEKYMRDHGA